MCIYIYICVYIYIHIYICVWWRVEGWTGWRVGPEADEGWGVILIAINNNNSYYC